jgi:hypothetical protein
MSAKIVLMVATGSLYLASCSKNNIIKVSGTINGVPAITLYGNSNRQADFILLSTDPATHEISYDGIAYAYDYISTGADIFITLSPSNIQKATLTQSASTTVLTLAANSQTIFSSSLYITK